jgi:hypothetical protein
MRTNLMNLLKWRGIEVNETLLSDDLHLMINITYDRRTQTQSLIDVTTEVGWAVERFDLVDGEYAGLATYIIELLPW